MKTVWITYSWKDNQYYDVDFVVQELEKNGLKVKLDRWNIQAGKRLWDQIENFITNKEECDGWILYATTNSLGSEPCREEFAYALDRALNSRDSIFPVIGLFPSSIDKGLIPAAVRVRLFVTLNDSDWKERISSTIEGRSAEITRNIIQPYALDFHTLHVNNKSKKVIEIRTRAGTWAPSFVAVLLSEKERINPINKYGPRGVYYQGGVKTICGECESDDGKWWLMYAGNEVTPSNSIFLVCDQLPSQIGFGVYNGDPQYLLPLELPPNNLDS